MTNSESKLWNSNYIKVWTGNFLMYFAFMLLTPLLPLYLSDTHAADKQVIGIVLSGYALAALLIRPFSGFFVDSFPRKMMLLIFYLLTASFFGGYLLAGSLTMFAAFRMLHGAPFGATGVSLATVAMDVLPSSRRAEGVGYFGLSNNIATAISPGIAMFLFARYRSYEMLFWLAFAVSVLGVIVVSTIRVKDRPLVLDKQPLSLDRFIMFKGLVPMLTVFTVGFAYSVVTTYVAIYGRDELGITAGTGFFFTLFAFGLIVSRLTGSRSLREGRILRNASLGILVSISGFILFAAVHHPACYYIAPLIIGLGNGHLWPAFQMIFINMAPHDQRGTANSTILTGWDLGMGVGMLAGGAIAEHFGYHTAFWSGIAVYAVGVLFYFTVVRRYYQLHKLHD
ncbi:MAG: MFS transporter [Paludibacteraceae bacterium]